MRVLGIDPGLRVTGLAVIEGGEVIASHSIRYKIGRAENFEDVVLGAHHHGQALAQWLSGQRFDVVGIEGFEDQGWQRKQLPNRHTTAMVCQALWEALNATAPDTPVRWQFASKVLDHRRGYGALFSLPRLLPGWEILRNEHERSAAVHAAWAARHEAGFRMPARSSYSRKGLTR